MTAPPLFKLPGPVDEVFVETSLPLVALAVGFSVGIAGKGEVGLPVTDELTGGAGGVDEFEGIDGGGVGNVDIGGGGEFVEGGGLSD